jgi:hypothetical protein
LDITQLNFQSDIKPPHYNYTWVTWANSQAHLPNHGEDEKWKGRGKKRKTKLFVYINKMFIGSDLVVVAAGVKP